MMGPFPIELFIHINLTLALLSLCLLVIIGRFMITEIYRYGWRRRRLEAAISIGVFMLGEVVRIGWVWLLRVTEFSGGNISPIIRAEMLVAPLFGAVMEVIGVLCMIRVFSPDDWGRHAWMVAAAVTLVIVGAEVFIISV